MAQKFAIVVGIGVILFIGAQFAGIFRLGGGLSYDPGVGDIPTREFDQRVPRDSIAPIYSPEFESAALSNMADDEMIMGVEINGESHAYSLTLLDRREMVNDVVGGIPILVTW
jgi:hypothetical protein